MKAFPTSLKMISKLLTQKAGAIDLSIFKRLRRVRWLIVSIVLALTLVGGAVVMAQTGGNFDLTWNNIPANGGTSVGGNFVLTGAVGQPIAGTTSGGSFSLDSGYLTCGGPGSTPQVTGLTPSRVSAGGSNFTLTVNGPGTSGHEFLNGANVLVNGVPRSTQFVNTSTLRVAVLSADISVAGEAPINVVNPAPNGCALAATTLTVKKSGVGITQVTPANGYSTVGITTTFTISWTHPTDNWRLLDNLDFRMSDTLTPTLWVRFHEAKNGTDASTFSLIDPSTGLPVGTASQGEKVVFETGDVILDMAHTTFAGSGPNPENRSLKLFVTVGFKAPTLGHFYNMDVLLTDDNGVADDPTMVGTWSVPVSVIFLPLSLR